MAYPDMTVPASISSMIAPTADSSDHDSVEGGNATTAEPVRVNDDGIANPIREEDNETGCSTSESSTGRTTTVDSGLQHLPAQPKIGREPGQGKLRAALQDNSSERFISPEADLPGPKRARLEHPSNNYIDIQILTALQQNDRNLLRAVTYHEQGVGIVKYLEEYEPGFKAEVRYKLVGRRPVVGFRLGDGAPIGVKVPRMNKDIFGLSPVSIKSFNDGIVETLDFETAKEILLHLKEHQPHFRNWSGSHNLYIPISGADGKYGKWKRANCAYLGVVELPEPATILAIRTTQCSSTHKKRRCQERVQLKGSELPICGTHLEVARSAERFAM
ncbi:hypothetical protein B5807_06790 [Epicoccum nigrum]|uniref:Uncharacterized protein n=1 Tax=Epicoccum nigrum TaxID=105696 RepID=A0A1Y2M0Y0_EPING|nr:hypothetical protein B5807_06790 [Epicoccum nigrum]